MGDEYRVDGLELEAPDELGSDERLSEDVRTRIENDVPPGGGRQAPTESPPHRRPEGE